MDAARTTSRTGRARRRAIAGLALVLAVGTGGCGGDSDGEPASGSASATGTGSATGVGGDAAQGAAECSPVGQELEAKATRTVAVGLEDFAFSPAEVEVAAGVVTFEASNTGSENHELAFLPGGGEVPINEQGEPDEDALGEAGAFELEAFGTGKTCKATYELEPGTYTLFCIVTGADGKTHYDKGMRARLVVT